MQVYLETARLVLRRFTEADADTLVELDSDPEVMHYLTGGIPTPRAEIERGTLPTILRYYERGDRYGLWAAIEKASGDFLGWFHLRPLAESSDDILELGYRLCRVAWGQGYATEGARALIRKGFAELGARRVVASTYGDNRASRRVMEKVGMTLARAYRPIPDDHDAPTALQEFTAGGDIETVMKYRRAARQRLRAELFTGRDVEYALERADWERQKAAGVLQSGGVARPPGISQGRRPPKSPMNGGL